MNAKSRRVARTGLVRGLLGGVSARADLPRVARSLAVLAALWIVVAGCGASGGGDATLGSSQHAVVAGSAPCRSVTLTVALGAGISSGSDVSPTLSGFDNTLAPTFLYVVGGVAGADATATLDIDEALGGGQTGLATCSYVGAAGRLKLQSCTGAQSHPGMGGPQATGFSLTVTRTGSTTDPLTVQALLGEGDDYNACTIDSCGAGGPSFSSAPAGTSCEDGDLCNGQETCDGYGGCVDGPNASDQTPCSDGNACTSGDHCSGGACVGGGATPTDDGNACTAGSCDPVLGVIQTPLAGCDDGPASVPALDPLVPTAFADQIGFLRPAMAEPLDPLRASWVRGRVLTQATPTSQVVALSGVSVSVVGHPEMNAVQTRDDGWFDIALNGGATLAFKYEKAGYISAQRQVYAKPERSAVVDDTILIAADVANDPLVVNSPQAQLIKGAISSDNGANPRSAFLMVPPNTTLSGGATGTLDVEMTEFTAGAYGPQRMPADLPPGVGYTYAIELSIPAAGEHVSFANSAGNKIAFYVHSIGLGGQGYPDPVGGSVPLGSLDRERGAWVAEKSGRVLKLTGVDAQNRAELEGAGGLTFADYELQQIANAFDVNDVFWRVELEHFSTYDLNWGVVPPPGAGPSNGAAPGEEKADCNKVQHNSIIECENQTLGEILPIPGTPYALRYQSDRVRGRSIHIKVPLVGNVQELPAGVIAAKAHVVIAGRKFEYSVPEQVLTNNYTIDIAWDGKDAFGREVPGTTYAKVGVGLEYGGVALDSVATGVFGLPGMSVGAGGVVFTPVGSRAFRTFTYWSWRDVPLERIDARVQGLGGWSLTAVDNLEPRTGTLFAGDGAIERGGDVAENMGTAAALAAPVNPTSPRQLSPAADGSTLVANGASLVRLAADGTMSTLAYGQQLMGAAQTRDGRIFTTELIPGSSAKGVYEVVSGALSQNPLVGGGGAIGEGEPGASSALGSGGAAADPQLAAAPDGSLYILDRGRCNIRKLDAKGNLYTVVGTNELADCRASTELWVPQPGSGVRARDVRFGGASSFSVAPDGSILIGGGLVIRISPDGHAMALAGGGTEPPAKDNIKATTAQVSASAGVAQAPDGSVYYLDSCRLRRISTDGYVATVGGTYATGCSGTLPTLGDGQAAKNALFRTPLALTFDGTTNRALVLQAHSPSDTGSIRAISKPNTGLAGVAHSVVRRSGGSVSDFNGALQHIATRDAAKGTTLLTMEYEPSGSFAGRIKKVTDAFGRFTQFEHTDNVVTVQSPDGVITKLHRSGKDGFLTKVEYPVGETLLSHGPRGLLRSLTDTRGSLHQFFYDAEGRLERDVNSRPGGGGVTLARVSAANAWSVAHTSAAGRVTKYEVDRNPYQAVNEPLRVELRTQTHPDGVRTTTATDASGKTTSSAYAKLATVPFATTTATTVPDERWGEAVRHPAVITVTDGETNPRTFTQTVGRDVTMTGGASNPFNLQKVVTSVTTTADGNATVASATTTFNANGSGDTVVKTPLLRQVKRTFDEYGRPTRVEMENLGPVAVAALDFEYDAITGTGRLTKVTQGAVAGQGGRSWQLGYSGAWVSTVTAPGNQVMDVATRDSMGRPLTVIMPGAQTLAMTRSATSGDVQTMDLPGASGTHSFAWDSEGSFQSHSLPDSFATTVMRNLDGQVTSTSNSVVNQAFGFDGAGRLVTTTASTGQNRTFAYNNKGFLSSAWLSSTNNSTFTYDGSLLTAETKVLPLSGYPYSHSKVLSHAYDNRMRRTMVSIAGVLQDKAAFDDDGLQVSVQSLISGVAQGTLTLVRDDATGAVTKTRLAGNGNTLENRFTYNQFGELLHHTSDPFSYYYSDSYNSRYEATYTRYGDAQAHAGKVETKIERLGGTPTPNLVTNRRFEYDATGRLAKVFEPATAQVAIRSYEYDGNGRRRASGAADGSEVVTDSRDRVTAYNTGDRYGAAYPYYYRYGHDAAGRRTTWSRVYWPNLAGYNPALWTMVYSYDAAGNLTQANAAGTVIDYRYDALGRRIAKHKNGNLERGWIWDGDRIVAEFNSTGAIMSQFFYTSGRHVPDMMLKGGALFRIVSDDLGSVRVVVKMGDGGQWQRLDYDEWGGPL
jgi:YD repeat-containing protein